MCILEGPIARRAGRVVPFGCVDVPELRSREPGRSSVLQRVREPAAGRRAVAGRRAEDGDGRVRRPRRLHSPSRATRSGGRPRAALVVPRARAGGAAASRAGPWRSSSATPSWRFSARRSRTRTIRSARCAPRSAIRDWADAASASSTCGSRSTPARRSSHVGARPDAGRGDGRRRRRQHRRAAAGGGARRTASSSARRPTARPATRSSIARLAPVAGQGQGGADPRSGKRSARVRGLGVDGRARPRRRSSDASASSSCSSRCSGACGRSARPSS